ncbi:MAG: class I SAM-dependent methyltransferase [Armatimonadetes bacterium]|nr:class I SAM-dependent methyltransferase [Armatimonadota bacterium]
MKLSETVRTGQPSAPVNLEGEGTAFFQQFVADLLTLNFKAAEALAAELLPVEPTGPFRVLDVAAGSGVWALGFARRSPRVEATLVDWPGVLEIARGCAARLGVEDRCRFLPGDLHAADFGPGYDVVLLGHILHCEGQTGSRRLLRKCFQALRPGGTLAIAEFVPNDDRRGPALPLLFAVNMLVSTQEGDTFTLQEIGTWLEDAGFGAVRTLEAPAPSPLILATRPAE